MQSGKKNFSGMGRWLVFIVPLLLGIVLVFKFYSSDPFEPPSIDGSREDISSAESSPRVEKEAHQFPKSQKVILDNNASAVTPHTLPLPPPSLAKKTKDDSLIVPVVGEVKMHDKQDNEIASIKSLVMSGGLVALPTRACLGAVDWQFSSYDGHIGSPVVDGIWQEGDPIGLWRVRDNAERSFSLSQWDATLPLSWLSLQTGILISDVRVNVEMNQGDLAYLAIQDDLQVPGVFIQNGKVVGWTFGDWLEGGYLWNRSFPSGNEFRSDVGGFYTSTFAGGREEQFVKAFLMDDDTSTLERLHTFLQGIYLSPKLDRADTPERLYLENVMVDIRYLARLLRHHGDPEDFINLMDEKVFENTEDVELLKITIAAIAEARGYGQAVHFVENTKEYFLNEQDAGEVSLVHLYLYKNWMKIVLSERDIENGRLVFERGTDIFPEDPELHLFGVELSLLEGDWHSAEELLYQREYPAVLRQNIEILAAKISELKKEEGSIVVRFPSGSSRIPVVARVNNRQDIHFLVDTGATLVTVPAALLDELGIEIHTNTPRRMVATAGGLKEAWEVNLSSIELGGWVVYDLKALVMDLPHRSQTGLLGLNFLEKFRMDLNTEKGILILEPL
ncbi:MAG: TIGR02281 family clan AA aspartic protease [Desulfovibrionaceae bacterium]|nr:TIGR02281 family clan AA aspartic protease [Desulfovibrionaceae bacterium]